MESIAINGRKEENVVEEFRWLGDFPKTIGRRYELLIEINKFEISRLRFERK